MCAEHNQERYLIEALAQAGERLTEWSNEERRHVGSTASSSCALQRKHHHTENNELFPAVIQRLEPEALHRLRRELESFDDEPSHVERRAAALDLGGDLIERYASIDGAGAGP